jgi:hypothetical protein
MRTFVFADLAALTLAVALGCVLVDVFSVVSVVSEELSDSSLLSGEAVSVSLLASTSASISASASASVVSSVSDDEDWD